MHKRAPQPFPSQKQFRVKPPRHFDEVQAVELAPQQKNDELVYSLVVRLDAWGQRLHQNCLLPQRVFKVVRALRQRLLRPCVYRLYVKEAV